MLSRSPTWIDRKLSFWLCKNLLENLRGDHFICRGIVTCDKKWIYFNNRDKQRQWLNRRGQVEEQVVKRNQSSQKALLCVRWNFEVVIHFELIPNGLTIGADLYCAQLDRMYAALTKNCLSLVNRKRILFQQDNAKHKSLWFTLIYIPPNFNRIS